MKDDENIDGNKSFERIDVMMEDGKITPLKANKIQRKPPIQESPPVYIHVVSDSEEEVNTSGNDNSYEYYDDIVSPFSDANGFAGFPSPGSSGGKTRKSKIATISKKLASAKRLAMSLPKPMPKSNDSHQELSSPKKRKRNSLTTADLTEPVNDSAAAAAAAPANTVLAAEQIVEIDSLSTNPRNTRNKFSESSSELPVSSASISQPGDIRCVVSKPHRPSLLKNTLPADSLERLLANITTRNPQMAFQEKIEIWQCSSDLSDVEDVNNFDGLFKRREEERHNRKIVAPPKRRNSSPAASSYISSVDYDYKYFRNVILNKFAEIPAPVLVEDISSSSKASSTPRRKWVAPAEAERLLHQKEQNPCCSKLKKTSSSPQSSTSPSNPRQSKSHAAAIEIYDKILSPSSSDSQTDINIKSSPQAQSPSFRLRWTDNDSVCRLHRLNRDIDNFSKARGIAKMRCDYTKELNFQKKTNDIFKTPVVPQRHFISGGDVGESSSSAVDSSLISSALQPQQYAPRYRQDEFCNYLGLTGMVTGARCSSNEKLGKCPSARRSLRVRRLQQQDLSSVKTSLAAATTPEKSAATSKRESQPAEQNNSTFDKINGIGNSIHNILATRSLVVSRPLTPAAEQSGTSMSSPKEPEIKIVCHIANQSSTKSLTELTTPSPVKISKQNLKAASFDAVGTVEKTPPLRRFRTRNTSNGASTCPRSSQSDGTTPPPPSTNPVATLTATPIVAASIFSPMKLRAARRSTRKSYVTTSVPCESVGSEKMISPHSIPMNENGFTSVKSLNKPLAISKNTDYIFNRYQGYLEKSRQIKPHICIVQSIDSARKVPTTEVSDSSRFLRNESSCSGIDNEHASVNVISSQKPIVEVNRNRNIKKTTNNHSCSAMTKNKRKKKQIIRRKFFTRSREAIIGGFSNQHRILRNRKIVIVKTVRSRNHHASPKCKEATCEPPPSNVVSLVPLLVRVPDPVLHHPDVVVSSTTDQQTAPPLSPPQSLAASVIPTTPTTTITATTTTATKAIVTTKDSATQSIAYGIKCLTAPSSPQHNPLKPENGSVLYAYYELDVLIVVQESAVSFWKTSKMISVLSQAAQSGYSNVAGEWVLLGESKRLSNDTEIDSPYPNRICVHNSMPIYVEMRAKRLHNEFRECNLLSLYINVYYFHDDEIVAKMHSIQLDTVASHPSNVIYTTITDSRYFIMSWSQENITGKRRSGLCKYSLTPHLDTLASIREFKSLRHEIRFLEFNDDDKLIGFGETQLTVWDHRSGDVLMNYDLDAKLGRNLGSIYYPSFEIGQNNLLLLFQYISKDNNGMTVTTDDGAPPDKGSCTYTLDSPELQVIACNISHNAPSYRILFKHNLSSAFMHLRSAIYTGDHVIVTAANDEEVWITASDPKLITHFPAQNTNRFYARCKQHLVEVTETSLTVDSFANHVLKIAAATDL